MRFPDAIGFPLAPQPDAHGRLSWPSAEDSVKQRIRCLLLTRPGEVIGNRRMGVSLTSFIGFPDTLETRRAIHDRIVEQVNRFEPRIILDRVEVFGRDSAQADDGSSPATAPGRLRIEIHYRLRRTGQAALIGLTLDLLDVGA
jgi:phage baseplate assembly protein W